MVQILFLFSLIISVGALAAPTSDKVLSEFFEKKTKIENPLELRDPFKSPPVKASKKDSTSASKGSYIRTESGDFANVTEVRLGDLDMFTIKVVGVLIGKERRAMVLPTPEATTPVIVKEGSKIGVDNAEVKAILPGGIVLVEKIINVYGQEEYLETVIPISR
jgi:Tfp pilus assembly protein PilP